MAHPSRLAMVEALAEGEKCVCELQQLVGSDISTVSKHLGILSRAGIVADRKEGLRVFYRLAAPSILDFLACVDKIICRDAKKALEIIEALQT